jgi:membrane dipeptidase
MRWKVAWAGLGLLLASALFFGVFPPLLAWRLSQHGGSLPPPMNAQAQSLHSKLLVVDLHAVTLMWSRDLLEQGTSGHVDLPRLTDGNVALQVFSTASRLSWRGDAHRGSGAEEGGFVYDLMTPLAVAQLWPLRTWGSKLERVLYQGEQLRQLVRRADSRLVIVRGQADIDRLLLARSQAEANGLTRPIGVMLSVNEPDPLENRLENLDALFDAGFRMAVPPPVQAQRPRAGAGLGHARPAPDRPGDGSDASGALTPIARQWLRRMEEKGMVVDVAHASPSTLRTVVENATQPVVASHTGLRGACDNPRNLSDEEARGIAATGGVIGIGFWREAVCDVSIDAIVKAIRYAVGLVGIDHVALGSNFDAGSATPMDAAGMAHLTHGLTAAGFSDEDIAKLSGGNALRVLRQVLPP